MASKKRIAVESNYPAWEWATGTDYSALLDSLDAQDLSGIHYKLLVDPAILEEIMSKAMSAFSQLGFDQRIEVPSCSLKEAWAEISEPEAKLIKTLMRHNGLSAACASDFAVCVMATYQVWLYGEIREASERKMAG